MLPTTTEMIHPDLSLIDLHRHMEGCIRLETILDLGRKYNLPLPANDLEGLRPHVQVTSPQPGVMAFIEKFNWYTRILVNPNAVRRISYENVEDLHKEGIDYAELRFSPWFMAEANHLDPLKVVEAVVDGVRSASRDFHQPVKLIGILSRTYGPDIAWKELQALASAADDIVALDLGGDEVRFPGSLFTAHYAKARDLGWKATVHAGESAGPESIWQAINELKAVRIGHGVTALRDPKLIDYMRDHTIAIEANLTSNVQTSTVPDYPSHPLKNFLQAGLLATINSDDPVISGVNLTYEYEVAAPAAGLSRDMVRIAQMNALKAAFLSPDERRELLHAKKDKSSN